MDFLFILNHPGKSQQSFEQGVLNAFFQKKRCKTLKIECQGNKH